MSFSRLPLLIEPGSLSNDFDKADFVTVDMRSTDKYLEGHVPGAMNINYTDIIATKPPVMGLLPDCTHLSAVFSAIGLKQQDHVVAYDDEGGGRASRLLWTLDVLGHSAFSLLNGGLHAWCEQGGPIEQGAEYRTPIRFSGSTLVLSAATFC